MTHGHGEKLTRKQEAAIAALLTAVTLDQAAGQAGVSPSTLKRWMALPDFKRRYAEARAGVLERTTARLLAASGRAVETLEEALEADKPADQIRAARAILAHCQRSCEQLDFAGQLAELRERVEEMRRGPRTFATRNGPAA
jgi:hypothetical protein